MTIPSSNESNYLLRFWLILITAFLAMPFGCSDHATDRDNCTSAKEFDYPHALGTNWHYLYFFYIAMQLQGRTEEHHTLHTWEVKSLTTNRDSTVAIVSAIRADTIHITQFFDGRYADTTYIHVDTLYFPIVFTSTSIISDWSNTVGDGFGANSPIVVPRTISMDTLKVDYSSPDAVDLYARAWYVNGVGLVKYTASTAGHSGSIQSLTLIDFVGR